MTRGVHLGDLLRITTPSFLIQTEPLPGTKYLNQKRELWPGLHTASASSFVSLRSTTLAGCLLPDLVWKY
jgi:hypothetical protein